MELALGGYAGFHTTTPPTAETAYGVYWPALIPARFVEHTVVLPDGTHRVIPHSTPGDTTPPRGTTVLPVAARGEDHGPTTRAPLGRICAARSGDTGGNANVGLWTRTAEEYAWLSENLTVEKFRELLPEADGMQVHRYELANLNALNFVVVGLLGDGVASSTRPDPQAKGLGEYLRSRSTEIPTRLLPAERSDRRLG